MSLEVFIEDIAEVIQTSDGVFSRHKVNLKWP